MLVKQGDFKRRFITAYYVDELHEMLKQTPSLQGTVENV